MPKHTRTRHRSTNVKAPFTRSDGALLDEADLALAALAAQHGRLLFDVPRDHSCQFHALLHALQTQLQPARATDYDVATQAAAAAELSA